MEKDFAQRIKRIENELLALKTGSKYSSAKPMNYRTVDITESGVYRITYENNGENILSIVVNALPIQEFEEVKARTVVGQVQDVEIYRDPALIFETIQLTILSTCKVINFEKIS